MKTKLLAIAAGLAIHSQAQDVILNPFSVLSNSTPRQRAFQDLLPLEQAPKSFAWSKTNIFFIIQVPEIPFEAGPTLEQRKQLAAVLKAYYQGLRDQVPNLKPKEIEWVKAEEQRLFKLGLRFSDEWSEFSNTRERKIWEFLKILDERISGLGFLEGNIGGSSEMEKWLQFAKDQTQAGDTSSLFDLMEPLRPLQDRSYFERYGRQLGVKEGPIPDSGYVKSGYYLRLNKVMVFRSSELANREAQKREEELPNGFRFHDQPLGEDPSKSVPYIIMDCIIEPHIRALKWKELMGTEATPKTQKQDQD